VRIKSNPYFSVSLIFILLMGYLIIHISNGRFTLFDFEVYYRAAERLISGQNLYKIVEDGHYIFKYSPVSAIYFIPLSLLPPVAAKIIYWTFSTLAFCVVLLLFYKMGDRDSSSLSIGRQNILILISFLCLGAFFELELHLGQVNIFILLLLVLSAVFSFKNRSVTGGLLLALSVFLKPFGLILLAYYIYRMKARVVLYFLIFSLILFFIPLIFYGSFEIFIEQNRLWIQEIIAELGNKQDLLSKGNNTAFSVLVRYTPLRWVNWTSGATLVFQMVLLLVISGLFLLLRKVAGSYEGLVPVELALVLCLIPLLAYTNRNLYIFNGMVSALLLIRYQSLHRVFKYIFIMGILISSFNIIEIWGDTITYKLEDWSFITLGTMLIWIALYISTYQRLKSMRSGS
jgi:hypothetical protein